MVVPQETPYLLRASFPPGALPPGFRLAEATLVLAVDAAAIETVSAELPADVQPDAGAPETATGVVIERVDAQRVVIDAGFPLVVVGATEAIAALGLGASVRCRLTDSLRVEQITLDPDR